MKRKKEYDDFEFTKDLTKMIEDKFMKEFNKALEIDDITRIHELWEIMAEYKAQVETWNQVTLKAGVLIKKGKIKDAIRLLEEYDATHNEEYQQIVKDFTKRLDETNQN
jgi:hypothetical protein